MRKYIRTICCLLVLVFLTMLLQNDVSAAILHEHIINYVSAGEGKHTAVCAEDCGYNKKISCTFVRNGNIARCKYCGYVEPLYLFKDGSSCNVYLNNGEMGRLHFSLLYTGDYSWKSEYVASAGKYSVCSIGYEASAALNGGTSHTSRVSEITEFNSISMTSHGVESAAMLHTYGDTIDSSGEYASYIGFNGGNNACDKYIDLSPYDTFVIEADSLNDVFADIRFCGIGGMIDVTPGKTRSRVKYTFDISNLPNYEWATNNFRHSGAYERHSILICGPNANTMYFSNIKMYALNTGKKQASAPAYARIAKEPDSAYAGYGEKAVFSVAGNNFIKNSRWFYKPSGGDYQVLTGNEEFLLKRTDTAESSEISIIANANTDGMSFCFQTMGTDDVNAVGSAAATLNIINDPITAIKISGIDKPVAAKRLDSSADVVMETYRGEQIEGKASIGWKNSGCSNEEAPNLEANYLASNNTYYTAVIEEAIPDMIDDRFAHPLIDGLTEIYYGEEKIDSQYTEFDSSANTISVEYGKGAAPFYIDGELFDEPLSENAFERTDRYVAPITTDIVKSVRCDVEENVEVNIDELLRNIAYENGVPDRILISQGRTITNQNALEVNSERLKDNIIEISGTSTRNGVTYEGQYIVKSKNYEDAKINVVLTAEETEKEGRYGILDRPGLYDSHDKLIYDWNSLISLGYIDASSNVLYETNGLDTLNGYKLILSRKLTQIRKDALKDTGIEIVQLSDGLIKVGRLGLGEICKVYYEGTMDNWEALSQRSTTPIAEENLEISFIDYKEVIPEITVGDKIYDGEEKFADGIKIKLCSGLQYYYYVNNGSLKQIKYNGLEDVDLNTVDIIYSNNINAGTANILINDKSERFSYEFPFEIKKAAAPIVNEDDFVGEVATYVNLNQKYHLYKDIPLDAGRCSISRNLNKKEDTIKESFDNRGELNITGIAVDTGEVYNADFTISMTNYEDTAVKVVLTARALDDVEKLEYDGEELEFDEAVSRGLIAIDSEGFITYIDSKLGGGLVIPDEVKNDKYTGYINGIRQMDLSKNPFKSLLMGKNLHILEIPKGLFCNSETLNNLILPKSLIKVGDDAFRGCHVLNLVYMPDSITELGAYSFADDIGLMPSNELNFGLRLPKNLEIIGKGAFYGDENISDIESPLVLPDSIKEIYDNAFEGVGYLSFEGDREYFEKLLNTTLTYEGQNISYPNTLDSVEFIGDTPGVYRYENEPLMPGFKVYTAAGYYYTYEERDGRLYPRRYLYPEDGSGLKSLWDGGFNYSYVNNDHPGEGILNITATGRYYGALTERFKINKGSLLIACGDEIIIPLTVNERSGEVNVELNRNDYLPGINLGDNYSIEFRNIERSDGSIVTLLSKGDASLKLKYDIPIEEVKKPFRAFSSDIFIRSDNYEEHTIKLCCDIKYSPKKENTSEDDSTIGKNAIVTHNYDEDGKLCVKVIERVGCMIDLSGDEYDITDYLPDECGSIDINLMRLDADPDEVDIVEKSKGRLTLSGYSEYPSNGIAAAQYHINSENLGGFSCEFYINSIKPKTTYVNKNVPTNCYLRDYSIDIAALMSDRVDKSTIDFASAGGEYRGKAEFIDGELYLGDMALEAGKIYWGYFTGRDNNYQSEKINLNINAVEKSVSTVRERKIELGNGCYAEYIPGYFYTGKRIKPVVKVYGVSGNELNLKKDVKVRFKNNIHANMSPLGEVVCQKYDKKSKSYIELKPTIEITFRGKYKELGKVSADFYIIQRDLSDYDVQTASKKALKKAIEKNNTNAVKRVINNKKKGISKKYYTVEYLPVNMAPKIEMKKVPSAQAAVRVKGKGDYCGSFIKLFTL